MARSIEISGAALLSLTLALTVAAQAQTPLDNLPPSPKLAPYQWFASTDLQHKNHDFFLLKPGETKRVPLAAGVLERLWSTALEPDKLELTLLAGPGRSQILLAGGKAQRGLLENKTFTFFPGLKGDSLAKLDAGAAVIATNKSAQPNKWFVQAAVRPAEAVETAPKAMEVSRRLFKIALAPGEEKQVQSWDTPGEIYEFTVSSDNHDAEAFSKLRLKASFDGQDAVNAPLLSLAGQVAGTGMLQNAVGDFDGSRLVLRWPMPFASAKLSIVNDGNKPANLGVEARVRTYGEAPSPFRFCAVERSATTVHGQPVGILDVNGQGVFMGLALSITPIAGSPRQTFAYLEGNESIIADGKTYEGTGTEDFFSSAWYFPEKPFFHPYEGLTFRSAKPPAISAYRFMLPDAVPFEKTLKFNFEQGNGNNTADLDWKWTAFWYQKTPIALPHDSTSGASSSPTDAPAGAPSVEASPGLKIGVALVIGIIIGAISAFTRRRKKV